MPPRWRWSSSAGAAPGVPAQAADAPVPPPVGYRFALGYGYGVGDHSGAFKLRHGTLDTDSAIGSAGGIGGMQSWIDNWLAPDWSIGSEYLLITRTDKARLSLPGGYSILTDPVNGNAGAKLSGHLATINIAYRPALAGWVHPSIGVGLGAGKGEVSAHYALDNDFTGEVDGSVRKRSEIAGMQGFMAIDFDLYDGIYASLVPRAIWVTAHPVGVNQQFLDFSVSGFVGVRF